MVLIPLQPPGVPPVTLADAKSHLRITHDAEDAPIAELITAAASFLTEDTGTALTRQLWRLAIGEMPHGPVELPRHPVMQIVTVTIYDANGTPIVLDGADYTLNTLQRPNTLTVEADAVPAGCTGIEIDFEAGFGDTGAEVPDTLRRAVLTLVAHWYEFRGVYDAADQPVSVPLVYSRLVRNWRRIGL